MLRRYFPPLDWGRGYGGGALAADLTAAAIVTIMLIPQSLAYAMLAGLPAEVGLYASIAPLVVYALLGTSRTLAVGPVAVVSLMTATAVGALEGEARLTAAAALAALTGAILLGMGLLRLGFLASFLSRPVVSGFITAAGLLIAASQLGHILGVATSGGTIIEIGRDLAQGIGNLHLPTLAIGTTSAAFLFWTRRGLAASLERLGVPPGLAGWAAKTSPALAVIASTAAVAGLSLEQAGVAVVGRTPAGLPPLALPPLDPELWRSLAGPALLIAVVGYVETIAVAQTLAAKRRQRVSPDQELIGLGGANLAASFSGGFPVAGGFARSVVNFDAGAETPAAGAFAAAGIALATIFLTPLIADLPKATLAATILVAVLGLIDLRELRRIWSYSKSDFAAVAATILVTLAFGVEAGVASGVGVSIALHLYRTSRPHVAIVGRVPGSEHFRNVERHAVATAPGLLSLRIDESLYFANARYLEDVVLDAVARDLALRDVVLMCSAVNTIDASALESLEALDQRLRDAGVRLHLSEVKGPVMDRLKRSALPQTLSGEIFLSQNDAFEALASSAPAGPERSPDEARERGSAAEVGRYGAVAP